MFIARILDQKQGEARVVDQQQVIRERLDQWLKVRPSAARLVELGILGRDQRFAVAREVIDCFLREKAQEKEDELAKIPPGNFEYSPQVLSLLEGEASPARLEQLRSQRGGLSARVEAASAAWARAVEDCRRSACSRRLPDASARVSHALTLLEAHRAEAGGSLAGVFDELHAFQRLLAKRRCLEDVVTMVEKSDAVREAAFAWAGAESLPIGTLEELLPLCARLPGRSRSVGLRRLRFVMEPLRLALAQELVSTLRSSGRWPLEAAAGADGAAGAAAQAAKTRAIGLFADLGRVQRAEAELRLMEGKEGGKATEAGDAPWSCQALASPLIARFRHHFCRPESDLCRMDKPEWGFRYLAELASDHGSELERWLNEDSSREVSASSDGSRSDLVAGLAVAIAGEARLFVRARLPTLAADAEAKPLLLHTMHHLVRFHADICAVGGSSAGAAAFADFDANRPLFETTSKVELEAEAAPSQPVGGPTGGGLLGVRLVKGLSKLASTTEEGGAASPEMATGPVESLGFLDVWAAADAEFVADKLSLGLAAEGGTAWRAKPLRHVSSEMRDGGAAMAAAVARSAEGAGSSPEAMELANLLADLFERAGERASCLATEEACKTYCACVLQPGLRQALAALKVRWNELSDPLEEARQSALLLETLQEMCIFLDSFPKAVHLATAADEASELRCTILDKLAGCFEEGTKAALRSLRAESSVFSYKFARPLSSLARWLRPENFRAVGRSVAGKLGSYLLNQLLRQTPFATEVEAELFAANCKEDLGGLLATLLDPSDLAQLQQIWDSCQLLTLPADTAMETLQVIQRASRLTPSFARSAADGPRQSTEVLERKQAEALEAAGVQALSAADASTVLRKRRDMAAAGFSEQETSFSVLQEMLPAGAAQATLQLGAGALQQLSEKAPLPIPSATASAAQARLQAGAAELRGFAGDASRLVAGRLRSTLAAAASAASAAAN